MIRNAIDHGIQSRDGPHERGSTRSGQSRSMPFKGNKVVIEVEDDDRGIDPKVVLATALRLGFTTPEEAPQLGRRS